MDIPQCNVILYRSLWPCERVLICLEVEHTGLHSQFYDKFNIRYHLSQVMMSVWNNVTHRKKLLQESKYRSLKILLTEEPMYHASFNS
jgi:hypothetical protein